MFIVLCFLRVYFLIVSLVFLTVCLENLNQFVFIIVDVFVDEFLEGVLKLNTGLHLVLFRYCMFTIIVKK